MANAGLSAQAIYDASRRMKERAARARDLTIPLKVVGAEIVKRVDDAFQKSRSPAGEPFPQLAEATRLARRGARKMERRLNRRDESGRLTKSAQNARKKAAEKGTKGIAYTTADEAVVYAKPMVDTARARNSQNTRVLQKTTLVWSAVNYLKPHMTGAVLKFRDGTKGSLPKRNVTTFEKKGGNWELIPELRDLLTRSVAAYIKTGKVTG